MVIIIFLPSQHNDKVPLPQWKYSNYPVINIHAKGGETIFEDNLNTW